MKEDIAIGTLLGLAPSLTVADATRIMEVINTIQNRINAAKDKEIFDLRVLVNVKDMRINDLMEASRALTDGQIEVMRKNIELGSPFNMSDGTFMCLSNAKLINIWEIVEKTDWEILQIKGFDAWKLAELKQLLAPYDLRLGMKFDRTIFTGPHAEQPAVASTGGGSSPHHWEMT